MSGATGTMRVKKRPGSSHSSDKNAAALARAVSPTSSSLDENVNNLLADQHKSEKRLMKPTSLAVACLLLLPLSAKCQCTGRSNEQIYSGGDQNPLTWSSLRNVLGQ